MITEIAPRPTSPQLSSSQWIFRTGGTASSQVAHLDALAMTGRPAPNAAQM